MRILPCVIAGVLLSAGVARADQTITLDASGITVTLPGPPGSWSSKKVDAGDGKMFDMLSFLHQDRALAFTVGTLPRGCSVWRTMPRNDVRSKYAYWPAGMVVFEARSTNTVTQKACLQLVRGAFMLLVTHGPSIDDQDIQNILGVLDAVTFAGGGAGVEPVGGQVGGTGDVVERVAMPGTGLAISVPGGAAAWTVTTQTGRASDIDYVVRKDTSRPWFQISAFQLRSPASCVTWERRARTDGSERFVASPGYTPRPFAFESRARKDGHFVGTSCLPTPRGDFLVLYEYRGGASDRDEDALARASIQSMIDSAGGVRDTSPSRSGGSGGFGRARPSRVLRHRVVEGGFTQISPSNSTLATGNGATLGFDSIVVGPRGVSGAGELETRFGFDSEAGVTADARLGLGAGFRGSFAIATLMAGAGYDAIGLGKEADMTSFKAGGALYFWLQGQMVIAVTRGLGLSMSYLVAERVGDNSGSESRFGAALIFRRRRQADIVLGLRWHDYEIGNGASSFSASLGVSY